MVSVFHLCLYVSLEFCIPFENITEAYYRNGVTITFQELCIALVIDVCISVISWFGFISKLPMTVGEKPSTDDWTDQITHRRPKTRESFYRLYSDEAHLIQPSASNVSIKINSFKFM